MSDQTNPEVPEQQVVPVMEITLPNELREQLKHQKLDDIIADLDYLYQTELRKLAEISQKFKAKIEESKTNVKDSYYTSKLEKNNEKIYDMLLQYEQSKRLLEAYKAQIEKEENADAGTQTV
jgi:bifunctional DNA-binding transcriptional regulator/antitoxin component of YhaV-PrlF toxin-antitoxin module